MRTIIEPSLYIFVKIAGIISLPTKIHLQSWYWYYCFQSFNFFLFLFFVCFLPSPPPIFRCFSWKRSITEMENVHNGDCFGIFSYIVINYSYKLSQAWRNFEKKKRKKEESGKQNKNKYVTMKRRRKKNESQKASKFSQFPGEYFTTWKWVPKDAGKLLKINCKSLDKVWKMNCSWN